MEIQRRHAARVDVFAHRAHRLQAVVGGPVQPQPARVLVGPGLHQPDRTGRIGRIGRICRICRTRHTRRIHRLGPAHRVAAPASQPVDAPGQQRIHPGLQRGDLRIKPDGGFTIGQRPHAHRTPRQMGQAGPVLHQRADKIKARRAHQRVGLGPAGTEVKPFQH